LEQSERARRLTLEQSANTRDAGFDEADHKFEKTHCCLDSELTV